MPEPLIKTPSLLTSRFNAHLTFNVLNTVQGFLLEKDPDGAIELVSCYARILRKMLINGRLDIPLKEEIDTVQDYLQIEKMRAGDGFSFSVEVDPTLNCLILPKSLVASFVENALHPSLARASVMTKKTRALRPCKMSQRPYYLSLITFYLLLPYAFCLLPSNHPSMRRNKPLQLPMPLIRLKHPRKSPFPK